MDWYRVGRPEWYVGEGWALTPETAGVAEADHRGPSVAPIDGWIDRRVLSGQMVIGGRSFDAAVTPRLTGAARRTGARDGPLATGAFLEFVTLPGDLMPSSEPGTLCDD